MNFKIIALLLAVSAASQAPRRIHSNISDAKTFVLRGNTRPAIAHGLAQDQGEVSPALVMPRLSLHFALSAAQQADLDQFLIDLQDRRSPHYRQFLTPEQYAARFGMNEADLAKVTAWLESNSFSNIEAARSRTWIGFNGSAGQAQTAFHTTIHNYVLDGETHFANASDPQLPAALQGLAMHVEGLHNFRMKPHVQMRPNYTTSVGSTFLTPNDWATIYDVKPLYGAGWDGSPLSSAGTACGGSPCSIVVVGQSDVQASDLAAFRTAANLPAKTIMVVVPPTDIDPGIQAEDERESDLDLEWANGIAPNANVLFVTAGGGVAHSITYAIDNNVAPIMTISYGLCEQNEGAAGIAATNALYQQANAQGMTVVSAAGDSGAADCDAHGSTAAYPASRGLAVEYPASSPSVTGVGGTTLTIANNTASGYWGSTNDGGFGSALSYIPETAWNDSVANGALSAGGGGYSVFSAKPSWQVGMGVPNDGHRDVPDLALAASWNENAYIMCGHNWCSNQFRNAASTLDINGGTSAGAPSFAGVLALLVQKMGTPLGNINPNLYTLAQAAPDAFHDIQTGGNVVACRIGTLNCTTGSLGYSAGVGYDQASGLGSIDAFNMVEYWAADIQITASPSAVSLQPGNSNTSTIAVAPLRGFTGAVSFACSVSSSLAGVSCSVPATTVTTSGSIPLTINSTTSAKTPGWWRFRGAPPMTMLLFVFLALASMVMVYASRKRRFAPAWCAAAALILLVGAGSCGSGTSSGGTTVPLLGPPETGSITVTATSGTIRNQVVVSVSIQ